MHRLFTTGILLHFDWDCFGLLVYECTQTSWQYPKNDTANTFKNFFKVPNNTTAFLQQHAPPVSPTASRGRSLATSLLLMGESLFVVVEVVPHPTVEQLDMFASFARTLFSFLWKSLNILYRHSFSCSLPLLLSCLLLVPTKTDSQKLSCM